MDYAVCDPLVNRILRDAELTLQATVAAAGGTVVLTKAITVAQKEGGLRFIESEDGDSITLTTKEV